MHPRKFRKIKCLAVISLKNTDQKQPLQMKYVLKMTTYGTFLVELLLPLT